MEQRSSSGNKRPRLVEVRKSAGGSAGEYSGGDFCKNQGPEDTANRTRTQAKSSGGCLKGRAVNQVRESH